MYMCVCVCLQSRLRKVSSQRKIVRGGTIRRTHSQAPHTNLLPRMLHRCSFEPNTAIMTHEWSQGHIFQCTPSAIQSCYCLRFMSTSTLESVCICPELNNKTQR